MQNSQSPLVQRDGGVGVCLAAQLDVFSVEVPVPIKPINWNIWFVWDTVKTVEIWLPLANRPSTCHSAYTEYRGWRCRWRPPRCTWWRRWASPCVSLCWAPRCSRSAPWTSRQSSGTLWWSLLRARSTPTCFARGGMRVDDGHVRCWSVGACERHKNTPDGCWRLPIGRHAGGHRRFQIGRSSH